MRNFKIIKPFHKNYFTQVNSSLFKAYLPVYPFGNNFPNNSQICVVPSISLYLDSTIEGY